MVYIGVHSRSDQNVRSTYISIRNKDYKQWRNHQNHKSQPRLTIKRKVRATTSQRFLFLPPPWVRTGSGWGQLWLRLGRSLIPSLLCLTSTELFRLFRRFWGVLGVGFGRHPLLDGCSGCLCTLSLVWWVSLGVMGVPWCGGCLCTAGSRLIWRERPARTGAQPPTGHPPNQTKPKRGFKKAISLWKFWTTSTNRAQSMNYTLPNKELFYQNQFQLQVFWILPLKQRCCQLLTVKRYDIRNSTQKFLLLSNPSPVIAILRRVGEGGGDPQFFYNKVFNFNKIFGLAPPHEN